MTVSELIEKLQEMPQDMQVMWLSAGPEMFKAETIMNVEETTMGGDGGTFVTLDSIDYQGELSDN
jgi:trehalose-6-phosphatase